MNSTLGFKLTGYMESIQDKIKKVTPPSPRELIRKASTPRLGKSKRSSTDHNRNNEEPNEV